MATLSPPFPFWPLEQPEKRLHSIFEAAQRRFPIISAEACETVMAFETYCCPREPTPQGTDITTEFLLWFLVLNDVDDTIERAKVIAAFREGLMFGDGLSQIHRGGQHFASLLTSLPDQSTIALRIDLMLEAFLWEAQTLTEATAMETDANLYVDPEALRRHRFHLIGNLAYVTLWQQCQGWGIRNRELVGRAEELATRIVALCNDISSVPRDLSLGKLNPILVAARGGDVAQHMTAAYLQYDESIDELSDLTNAATTDFDYLQYLKAIVSGNIRAMQCLSARYNMRELTSGPR